MEKVERSWKKWKGHGKSGKVMEKVERPWKKWKGHGRSGKVMEKVERSWKKSWKVMNLKSSKEYEPCFLLLPQLSRQTSVETLAMQTTTLPNNSFARAAHFLVHFIVTARPQRENVYFHLLWRT